MKYELEIIACAIFIVLTVLSAIAGIVVAIQEYIATGQVNIYPPTLAVIIGLFLAIVCLCWCHIKKK